MSNKLKERKQTKHFKTNKINTGRDYQAMPCGVSGVIGGTNDTASGGWWLSVKVLQKEKGGGRREEEGRTNSFSFFCG